MCRLQNPARIVQQNEILSRETLRRLQTISDFTTGYNFKTVLSH
jgi:hypothetical protein